MHEQDQMIHEQPMEETNEQQPTAEESATEATQDISEQSEHESNAERNFAALRKAKEAAERERDAYYQRLREVEETKKQSKEPKKESPDLGDDDLAEGRHLKALREELQQYKNQIMESTVEAKLKSQYPDFDRVVTKDAIERLRTAYPELASTIHSSTDLYSKGASAYTLIKQFGLDGGYDTAKETVAKNIGKPKSAQSASPQSGNSPLSQAHDFANGLTDDLKQRLYREMLEAQKRS